MLIPPRCFTCGNVLADKWVPYINTVREEKNESKEMFKENELDIKFIDVNKKVEKSIEGKSKDTEGTGILRFAHSRGRIWRFRASL